MVKIKICGITSVQEIEAVNKWRPDYIGFVFAESKRRITEVQAKRLKETLDPEIQTVGVFVNDEISRISELCRTRIIDMVQLHGDETENYIKELREQVCVPVMKAFRLQKKEDATFAETTSADYVLFDSFVERKQYGGTGKEIDQSLIPKLVRPTFIAGGIEEHMVNKIIMKYHPYGIDVSSGVETDGKKDSEKIKRLIQEVRKVGGKKYE